MTTITEPRRDSQSPQLTPVLGTRFVLRPRHAFLCLGAATFFLYLNYIPLFHSDIWGHVLLGQWIWEHGRLPVDDPFLPLAEGMRVVDSAWLSQVIFGWVESWGGAHFLSNVFAVVVFATYAFYARTLYLLTGRWAATLGGLAFLFFLGFSRHAIIRPEIFGGLCLSLLVWMVVRLEPWRSRARGFRDGGTAGGTPGWVWVAVPLLFVFWANAHGSYAVGLVFLACHALGSLWEAAWRTRGLKRTLSDPGVWRWTFLTELAVAGSLINPYGLDLLIATARFGGNPNLEDVLEWFPLKLIDLEGLQFLLAMILVMVCLRLSRARFRAADIILMAFFGLSVAPTVRMIGWLAPVLTLVMMPHIADLLEQVFPSKPAGEEPAASPARPLTAADFRWTLISGFILWCGFALSPISQPVLGGKPRADRVLYSQATPHGISAFLRQAEPEGLVLAPQWWGDWMVWDGPPDLKIFMTTNLHLVPNQVWRDYLLVARGQAGWQRTLDRYDVQWLIVHKELQKSLSREARQSANWRLVHEDELGLVFRRRDPWGDTRNEANEEARDEDAEGEPITDADENQLSFRTPVTRKGS